MLLIEKTHVYHSIQYLGRGAVGKESFNDFVNAITKKFVLEKKITNNYSCRVVTKFYQSVLENVWAIIFDKLANVFALFPIRFISLVQQTIGNDQGLQMYFTRYGNWSNLETMKIIISHVI